jgi:type II pantothenate kinase
MATLDNGPVNVDSHETSAVLDDAGTGKPVRAPPIPASVKINVKGAFIVNEENGVQNGVGSEYVHKEHKDIRLPHHTDVVSHVAVDV